MKIGFVVCTRMQSRRVPQKCALNINGSSILEHLYRRLRLTDLPVIFAYPEDEWNAFSDLIDTFDHNLPPPQVYAAHGDDPLKRMYQAAEENGLDAVIRVTHDKIFIDPDQVFQAIGEFRRLKLDYLYSSDFMPGTAFEIISTKALEEAAKQYDKVEHISYAIKAVTKNKLNFRLERPRYRDARLLIDFPEDVDMMTKLLAILGNDCTQDEALRYLHDNGWLRRSNYMPQVTIYTCAYNAEEWLQECMDSVLTQVGFHNSFEYIIVDDHSTDSTPEIASKFATRFHKNVKYIRNAENVGLASSSNVALKNARGEFIIRLDADDYFSSINSVKYLREAIMYRKLDAIYPNNYHGSMNSIQPGDECHHVGGAIFRTRAINHIKFTERLRNYEGYDFWLRAKESLDIGYLNNPIFFYRQREDSMSATNLDQRAKTKAEIEQRAGV